MRTSLSLLLLANLFIASQASASSLLGQYNLILIEDYNFQGGDVQGAAFIGGDLNSTGAMVDVGTALNSTGAAVELGSRLENTDTAIDALTVVGDINAGIVRVLNDNNVVYGGSLRSDTTVELNDGDDGQLIHDQSLSIGDIVSQLHADAATYANLAANGSFSNGKLTYTGSDEQAVFNVSSDDVFSNNSNVELIGTTDKTVIINVSVSSADKMLTIPGSVNLNNGFNTNTFSNILWNFYDATSIDFGALNVKGSVLAPYADTTGSANIDGAYAALSFTGAREYHNFLFNGGDVDDTTQTSVVEAPAPSTIAIFLVAVLVLMRKGLFAK